MAEKIPWITPRYQGLGLPSMYVLRSKTFFKNQVKLLGFFLDFVVFGLGFSSVALDARLGFEADSLGCFFGTDPLRLELRPGDLARDRDRDRDRVDAMV